MFFFIIKVAQMLLISLSAEDAMSAIKDMDITLVKSFVNCDTKGGGLGRFVRRVGKLVGIEEAFF